MPGGPGARARRADGRDRGRRRRRRRAVPPRSCSAPSTRPATPTRAASPSRCPATRTSRSPARRLPARSSSSPARACTTSAPGSPRAISTRAAELFISNWPAGTRHELRLRLTSQGPYSLLARASFRRSNGSFVHLPANGRPDQQGAPTRVLDLTPRSANPPTPTPPPPPTNTPAPPPTNTPAPPPTQTPVPPDKPAAGKPAGPPSQTPSVGPLPPAPPLGGRCRPDRDHAAAAPTPTVSGASSTGGPSIPLLLAGFGIIAVGVAVGIVALVLLLRRRSDARPARTGWPSPGAPYPGPGGPYAGPGAGHPGPGYPPVGTGRMPATPAGGPARSGLRRAVPRRHATVGPPGRRGAALGAPTDPGSPSGAAPRAPAPAHPGRRPRPRRRAAGGAPHAHRRGLGRSGIYAAPDQRRGDGRRRADAPGRAVRRAGPGGPGRHGLGLQGVRLAAAAVGRAQDHARRSRPAARLHRPLHPRGAGGGDAGASEHRHRLRHRADRRLDPDGDVLDRGQDLQRVLEQEGALPPNRASPSSPRSRRRSTMRTCGSGRSCTATSSRPTS